MKPAKRTCKLFTNHAQVLLYLSAHKEEPLRKVALAIGVTERSVQLMVADLEAAGYLERNKVGRQNRYQISADRPLQHPLEPARSVGELLEWARGAESDLGEYDRALENWTIGEHGSEIK